jgi:hypothetical protein
MSTRCSSAATHMTRSPAGGGIAVLCVSHKVTSAPAVAFESCGTCQQYTKTPNRIQEPGRR